MKFKKGDEVFTDKNYKSLIKNKPYIVFDFYKTPGYIATYEHYTIELMNEFNVISRYSPVHFKKTKKQFRIDKFKKLLSC